MNGLVLSLGGAPESWHVVEGFEGWFHPLKPVPVEEPGFPSLEQAQAADADEGCPLRLVNAPRKRLDQSVEEVRALRAGVLKAADGSAAPPEQIRAELEAAGLKDRKR